MLNILGSIGLAYIAGSGTVTNTAVVGRGLFGAARKAVEGQFRDAAAEALGALAAPALMSYAATASLVMDALEGAGALVSPVLDRAEERFEGRHAANW